MWIQKVPGGGVIGLAYSPDGRTLYTADRGCGYTAWDTTTRKGRQVFYILGLHGRIALAAAGRYFLVKDYRGVFIWDLVAGAKVDGLDASIAYDSVPVPGSNRVLYRSEDRLSLLAWEPGGAADAQFAGPFPNPVRAYDLSPDARTIAYTADSTFEAILFDLARKTEKARFPTPSGWGVWGMRFSPDGRILAVFSAAQVQLWDISSRTRLSGAVDINTRFGELTFSFHPSAPVFVAVDREQNLTLFCAEGGEPIRLLDFALGRKVQCVAFSPDGLTCAVGGSNKQFAVFDVDV
jgi:WD40 repeat protein